MPRNRAPRAKKETQYVGALIRLISEVEKNISEFTELCVGVESRINHTTGTQ